jgi:phage gp29-like protein
MFSEFRRSANPLPEGSPTYRYEPSIDRPRRVSDRLTFKRLSALLRAAEDGDAESMLQLNTEMESKDIHLKRMAETRRTGLTRLQWEIEPASRHEEGVDEDRATAAADFVRDHLRRLVVQRNGRPVRVFTHMLTAMSGAIGPNLKVFELVWNGPSLRDIAPIPHTRLTFDLNKSQTVRIVTYEQRMGIVPQVNKFVIHSPDDIEAYPFTNTIAKAQAVVYLMKHLAQSDWQSFCELFGQPMRVGKYGSNVTTGDKTILRDALKDMGTNFWGMIPDSMSIEMIETANRQAEPYSAFIELLERKQTIGYLGQTLTTDTTAATGTYAAARVHNEVRLDILEEDIEAEARTIEEQLFAPMVEFHWPGQQMPVPKFVRQFREEADRVLNGQVLDIALNRLGMQIEVGAAHELLQLPEPERDEEGNAINDLLKPMPATPVSGGFPAPGGGFSSA